MAAKTKRVMEAGMALAAGAPGTKPLNPAWDARWMDAIGSGRLDDLLSIRDQDIAVEAGLSAHESKAWLIGRAAIGRRDVVCRYRYYRAVPELIAGYGVMFLRQP
jgi:2,3-dihydroxyphenylpropionate 1,2-dioxygenase